MAELRFEVRRADDVADDVACGGSGAVVELNHASDSSVSAILYRLVIKVVYYVSSDCNCGIWYQSGCCNVIS